MWLSTLILRSKQDSRNTFIAWFVNIKKLSVLCFSVDFFLVMTLVVVEVNMLGVGQAVSWKALITCSFLISKQMHSIVLNILRMFW